MKRVYLLIISLFAFSYLQAAVIFVDSSALGKNNGKTWQNAYICIQSALAVAKSSDQIWVAKGVYYPTKDSNINKSFIIPKGVSLLGGFQGSEKSANERNFEKNKTILSGEIFFITVSKKHLVNILSF